MADTPKLRLRAVGKTRGETGDTEKNRVAIKEDQYPELLAALRAYFEKNPDVGSMVVRARGD